MKRVYKEVSTLKRITFTIAQEANEVYEKIKPHDRSRYVSEAIIEKYYRQENTMDMRITELERKVKELEKRAGKAGQ